MDAATTVTERAIALLRERGAAEIAHPGGELLAHLLRANEMDVLRSARLDASMRASFHPLFRALARHAPAASARALAELSDRG